MVEEKTLTDAMQIILHAGDARKFCMNALTSAGDCDFEQAQMFMNKAHDKIVCAHHVQTNAITAETTGEKGEYSVLFVHAQDTLMTIYSEINMTKHLIGILRKQDDRIKLLEKAILDKGGKHV